MYLGIFRHTLTAVECLLAINVLRVQTSQGGYGEEGWWLRWCTVATYDISPSTFACFPSFGVWSPSEVCPPLRCCWFQHHQPGPRSWRVASFNPWYQDSQQIRIRRHMFRAASMVSWFQTGNIWNRIQRSRLCEVLLFVIELPNRRVDSECQL